MKHKRTISVEYNEKDIDLSSLVKIITEKLVSITPLKEVQ